MKSRVRQFRGEGEIHCELTFSTKNACQKGIRRTVINLRQITDQFQELRVRMKREMLR